jgi:hypothetical protein
MTQWSINPFVSGAFVMACLAVALFYVRYWQRTHDRLFAILAMAFVMLSIERFVLGFVPAQVEGRHLIFLLRLAAYATIIAGVVDKNWPRREPPATD